MKKLSVTGANLYFDRGRQQMAGVLGSQLHITYRSVGIFHSVNGQLIERWGGIQIE